MTSDTDAVDVMRQRESAAWQKFIGSGSLEDLREWRHAFTVMVGELEHRVLLILAPRSRP